MSDIKKDNFLGRCAAAISLRSALIKAAAVDTPVLITGEVGSGRTHAARYITSHSKRKNNNLTIISSASLSASFAESELFGHQRGAFTGATDLHIGSIERANGGTVLFTDIQELPEVIQPRLLRFFEDKTFRRLGGTDELTADIRILATANTDLQKHVQSGNMRADLYYRLKGLEIKIPPLRLRSGDAIILAEHFLNQYAAEFNRQKIKFTKNELDAINAHEWNGNIRELQNTIKGAVIFAEDKLDIKLPDNKNKSGSLTRAVENAIAETEINLITSTLEQADNNRTKAAEILGISRRGLQLKLKKYGIK